MLYAEASALFAHVLHGRREDVAWLADRVAGEGAASCWPTETLAVDFPILGGLLLAEGCWVADR